MIRQFIVATGLLMMLGMEPPSVQAQAVTEPAPFRYAIVTPKDSPEVIYVQRTRVRGRHVSRIVVRKVKHTRWRYV